MSYYDLSASDYASEEDDESQASDNREDHFARIPSDNIDHLWTRSIVHVDVDCFYCQCEQVDGPPDYRERPLAIGQKHIVVTCNYLARALGVKKLQSKIDAVRICPSLLILDGSDLERYRRHSRNIYLNFRNEIKSMANDLGVFTSVRKGSMDEAFADLTNLVTAVIKQKRRQNTPSATYVYGNDLNETSVLTEDQSGAQTIVHAHYRASASENAHVHYGSDRKRRECQERLECAASIAEHVRNVIHETLGFTTTMGISVSPMLSKLSSDLKKPNSLNILFPWRSGSLIPFMPLGKIPELGHGTLKALQVCLAGTHDGITPASWTCRHLIHVPRHEILASLEQMKSFEKSSDQQCTMLLEKCRGVDHSEVPDDDGGLTKTVSVENSMRRGTTLTKESVWKEVNELFRRLPRLLIDRQLASMKPELAVPTTFRLTVRLVDKAPVTSKRSPTITRSKQVPFDGKEYMRKGISHEQQFEMLRILVNPLLDCLAFDQGDIDMTRINLATTNFLDLKNAISRMSKGSFVPLNKSLSQSDNSQSTPLFSMKRSNYMALNSFVTKRPKVRAENTTISSDNVIDPTFLAELPPTIAEEIRQSYKQQLPPKTIKKGNIDCFFARKSKNI